MEEPIMTIKELYEWACKKKVEDFTLLVADEDGMWGNCYEVEIEIHKKEKTVSL